MGTFHFLGLTGPVSASIQRDGLAGFHEPAQLARPWPDGILDRSYLNPHGHLSQSPRQSNAVVEDRDAIDPTSNPIALFLEPM